MDEREPLYTAAAKLLQSCPTLCDPTDGSPPGSPVPGILQARILEWVAISFSSLCTTGRDINQNSHYGKEYGVSSKNSKQKYHMI